MASLPLIIRILLLLSSLLLVVGALRALARDRKARRRGAHRPDRTDLAIAAAMLALGLLGAILSARSLS